MSVKQTGFAPFARDLTIGGASGCLAKTMCAPLERVSSANDPFVLPFGVSKCLGDDRRVTMSERHCTLTPTGKGSHAEASYETE